MRAFRAASKRDLDYRGRCEWAQRCVGRRCVQGINKRAGSHVCCHELEYIVASLRTGGGWAGGAVRVLCAASERMFGKLRLAGRVGLVQASCTCAQSPISVSHASASSTAISGGMLQIIGSICSAMSLHWAGVETCGVEGAKGV